MFPSGLATQILAHTALPLYLIILDRLYHHHHHHHVPEGLDVFPVPWSSRWSWSLHLFLGRPMFLRPFALYCSACFGSLFVSILCTCCSHFFWYCFISFTMFCTPVFCLIHWFFSLSSFIIPSKCLKNFICAASKRCSSLFFSTQASLPNFNNYELKSYFNRYSQQFTGRTTTNHGSIPGMSTILISSPNVLTSSGAHPASYPKE